jgi:uncharacterized protein (TIGR03546 family)
MPLKAVIRVIASLNSNQRPGEVGAGIAFGLLLALQPGIGLLWAVIFAAAFFVKLNEAAMLLFMFLFTLAAPLFDGVSDLAGFFILNLPVLNGFFTALGDMPIVPLTRFNNSLVMGGLALGLLLWLPVFLAGRRLVVLYRKKFGQRLLDHPLAAKLLKSPLLAPLAGLIEKAK